MKDIKEYAIFGAGSLAKKFYYFNKRRLNIKCFYDNAIINEDIFIDGIQVIHWDNKKSYKIIIASSYYKDIALQLCKAGFEPIKDFVLWNQMSLNEPLEYKQIFDISCGLYPEYKNFLSSKKIAVVYGNCQTGKIEKLLSLSKEFNNDYYVVYIPKVCEYIEKKDYITHFINDNNFFNKINLFIYQKVGVDNRFSSELATDHILEKINREICKTVCISNIYFDGYFPQYKRNTNSPLKTVHQSGLFPFADKFIDKMISDGMKTDDIVEVSNSKDMLSEDEINSYIFESFNELRKREKGVDIGISDYLECSYKDEQLFYSPNHPCKKVLEEYVNRILNYIGYDRIEISESDFDICCSTLKGQDIPIYPCVANKIKLKKYEKSFYPNRYLDSNLRLDFCDYIRLYIQTKYDSDIT